MEKIKVKFCGFTNIEDIKDAVDLGVDYIGIVIDFPKSPRSVRFADAFELFKKVKVLNRRTKTVAVTVDTEPEKLELLINSKLVDVIQLHGNESAEVCKKLKSKVEIWKAFKALDASDEFTNQLTDYKNVTDRILLDASSLKDKAEQMGRKFNQFDIFKDLNKQSYKLILAGGLDSKNVKEYRDKLNVNFVDVSSGIESYPGKKDKSKMQLFIKNLYE